MDTDYSNQLSELPLLLQPLIDNRADLVLGSRELGHCESGALLPHQRFGNWLTAQLIHSLYRVRVTDLGPFRAIRRA